jgi:hypothetical protein
VAVENKEAVQVSQDDGEDGEEISAPKEAQTAPVVID